MHKDGYIDEHVQMGVHKSFTSEVSQNMLIFQTSVFTVYNTCVRCKINDEQ